MLVHGRRAWPDPRLGKVQLQSHQQPLEGAWGELLGDKLAPIVAVLGMEGTAVHGRRVQAGDEGGQHEHPPLRGRHQAEAPQQRHHVLLVLCRLEHDPFEVPHLPLPHILLVCAAPHLLPIVGWVVGGLPLLGGARHQPPQQRGADLAVHLELMQLPMHPQLLLIVSLAVLLEVPKQSSMLVPHNPSEGVGHPPGGDVEGVVQEVLGVCCALACHLHVAEKGKGHRVVQELCHNLHQFVLCATALGHLLVLLPCDARRARLPLLLDLGPQPDKVFW
mmetsp:Transcript_5706/g.13738  ORF Transcript_5706/g.13738 Transcript_5706/m.13738 type:complete len:276 (-) Transcript_5706:78-905(-)